ncbi:hypothetical protein [Sphingomonas sp. Mn802worker]|uniref:hypothetical protein n=1 Tax=Sphingomonas sp. Mn802worker TaxID=629773 RepID=UPI00037A6D79|nr:hypothetical protein [Sphingomonas sp. Mn802worker]
MTSMLSGEEVIARATQVAAGFRATSRGSARAGYSVYLILLHHPARRQPWGIYVGQTVRDPDQRFDQHKAGYKSSGAVRRFGVQLLPEAVAHLNPMERWESIELEEAIAAALSAGGIGWVEGGH